MPSATLLLREQNTISLTSIVERALQRKPPLLEYELQLTSTQLDFTLNQKNEKLLKSNSLDEGFESDIDSISIVSCDETDLIVQVNKEKLQETDSANGSACSDTDDAEASSATKQQSTVEIKNECFNLVDCSCYTDVRAPDILIFVIKNETFVFKLDDFVKLQRFYANFSAFKAVANQKTYNGKNVGTKFNLLQRTDCNGITHIEISREGKDETRFRNSKTNEPSSIISLNTPETNLIASSFNSLKLNKERNAKIWNSAEDLLDSPKKPDRRKKVKAKAPLPPLTPSTIDATKKHFPEEYNTKLTTYQQFSGHDAKTYETSTLNRKKLVLDSWTNSVPRLLKKQRSKSETRNFTPMAYRYIDTTIQTKPKQLLKQLPPPQLNKQRYETIDYLTLKKEKKNGPSSVSNNNEVEHTISNRLFGMSSKLRDFSAVQNSSDKYDNKGLGKWSSLGELSYKLNNVGDGSLKSVIKKDDSRRKNEKKVTFSAYTTVQVV